MEAVCGMSLDFRDIFHTLFGALTTMLHEQATSLNILSENTRVQVEHLCAWFSQVRAI